MATTVNSPQYTEDTIVAEVLIAAPNRAVWAALTDSVLLAEWWGSPETYRAEHWTLDLRAGEKWTSSWVGVDGTPFTIGGELLEVSPMGRLVMTWEPGYEVIPPTRITYALKTEGNGTRLRMTHEGFSGYAASRDRHGTGWQRVLGWLVAFVERRAAVGG